MTARRRMSFLLLILFASTIHTSFGDGIAVADAPGGSHRFILSGQSNMNGLKPEDTLLPTLQERFGAERRDLSYEDIKFITGRLSDFGIKQPQFPDWNSIRKLQVKIADASK